MRRTLLAILMLSAVPGAWADKPGNKGKSQGNRDSGADVRVSVNSSNYRISREEVVVISDYYRGRPLPPGLAKKLRRGGSLPPGWQKKIQPVPVVVEQRLAPVPAGFQRGILDGAFVVYDSNRGLIVDGTVTF